MSVSKWAYSPEKCDGRFCYGECDLCPEADKDEPVIVIRCKNCKHWKIWEDEIGHCGRSEDPRFWFATNISDFCSYGERREELRLLMIKSGQKKESKNGYSELL